MIITKDDKTKNDVDETRTLVANENGVQNFSQKFE